MIEFTKILAHFAKKYYWVLMNQMSSEVQFLMKKRKRLCRWLYFFILLNVFLSFEFSEKLFDKATTVVSAPHKTLDLCVKAYDYRKSSHSQDAQDFEFPFFTQLNSSDQLKKLLSQKFFLEFSKLSNLFKTIDDIDFYSKLNHLKYFGLSPPFLI